MSFRILKRAMIAWSVSSMLGLSAFAEDQLDDQNWRDNNERYCARLSYDPQTCNRTAGCQYDPWQRQCVRNHVTPGDPSGNSCWNIYDPVSCNLTPGCYFDRGSNRCAQDPMQPNPWPNPNPNPWPQPVNQCWQYSNNPYQCQQTYGCAYDQYSNQCVSTGSPGGQGQIVSCGSGQYNYTTCPLNGYAYSVRLVRVVSRANCVEGQSWGWNSNSIWVDDGCRADFAVRY